MSLGVRIRDAIGAALPPWLSNRVLQGLDRGWRFVWALIAPLDSLLDQAYQGLKSRFPELGTPTALPLIGRSRGLLRGRLESQSDYATRLRTWLDVWPNAGSAEIIATVIQQYLGTSPVVRVIQRGEVISGTLQPSEWLTLAADGTLSKTQALWNWDTISHPERSDETNPDWSDEWVIVQLSPFAQRGGTTGTLVADTNGLGHLATREEVDAIHGLIAQWKGAHSCVNAVIWTTDATLFNPADQTTCPNGKWGAWGKYSGSSYVPGDRNTTSCRFYEPR